VAKQEVALKQTSEVGLPTEFLAELANEAKDAAAQERPAVSKLSTAGGQLRYQGDIVAGNNMDVVILYASYRNVWYAGAYDRENIKNPDCFSLSETDEGMVPDPVVKNPPNATCGGCPKNEWKSDVKADGRVGKGKACKESRRLVMMPAGALDSVDAVKAAELAILDLPVTSAKNYNSLVNTVAATVGVPVWACVTNVKEQPHPKNQFEIVLTPLRVAPSKEIILALKDRVADAKRIALEPYDETSSTNSAVIASKQKEKF
jgi:hypothetical protein